MPSGRYLFTSESVTEGHPDKIADQISDAILDGIFKQDPYGRVACETLVTTGLAFVAGEIQEQSADIGLGVDIHGAGDQGLMFGYATRETPEMMPMPIMLAHKLCRRLAEVRKQNILDYLRPDGKSQVTVEYVDGEPSRVTAVVVAAQVVLPVVPRELLDQEHVVYHINPTGRFVIGGPKGDTGLTGRKIIVDTYGGVGSHGGGCYSGKDPTKVDRSASYMARYIAKNIVAAHLADKCEVQLAYAIGVPEPVSVMVDTSGTGMVTDEVLCTLVRKHFELTPAGILKALDLRRPIFKQTAAYGHFGRNEPDFTWERIDRADVISREAGRIGA